MNKKTPTLLAMLSLLVVVTYCGNQFSLSRLTRNSGNTTDNVTETPIEVPDGADSSQDYFRVDSVWEQTEQTTIISPEIMFVLDRSGSMSDNVDALVDSLVTWMDKLETLGLTDYCVSLMGGVSDSWAGKLQGTGGEKCFCRHDYSNAEIKAKFQASVDSATGGNGGSTSEAGLYSIYKSLTDNSLLSSNQAAGCFRSDMSLAVILMTDEQDDAASVDIPAASCTGSVTAADGVSVSVAGGITFDNSWTKYGQNGWSNTETANNFNPNFDICGEGKERIKYVSSVPVNGEYVNIITPASVVQEIVDYNNTLPTYLNSITFAPYSQETYNFSNQESPGHGAIEFAEELDKEFIPLNIAVPSRQSEFNTAMDALATDLVESIAFLNKFDFADPVCEGLETSIRVEVIRNGNTIDLGRYNESTKKWTLASDRLSITIKSSFTFVEGDEVKIRFTKCE